MKKYIPYLLLAILIVAFVIREMFHSKYNMKEALKLQSEQNRSAYLYKQLHESKDKEAQSIDIAVMYKKDVDRLESFVKDYKAKLKYYEKKDRITIRNYTPTQLDSIFAKRYPKPDSVYFSNPAPGVN